jgi:hypothetical protein
MGCRSHADPLTAMHDKGMKVTLQPAEAAEGVGGRT